MVIKKYKSKRKNKKKNMVKTKGIGIGGGIGIKMNNNLNKKTKKNNMIGSGYNQMPQQYGYPVDQNEINRQKEMQKQMIIKIIDRMIRNRKRLEKQKHTFKGKRAYKEIPEAYE
jgi:hypothetical protein